MVSSETVGAKPLDSIVNNFDSLSHDWKNFWDVTVKFDLDTVVSCTVQAIAGHDRSLPSSKRTSLTSLMISPK
jgi:hypothetical protein